MWLGLFGYFVSIVGCGVVGAGRAVLGDTAVHLPGSTLGTSHTGRLDLCLASSPILLPNVTLAMVREEEFSLIALCCFDVLFG